MLLLLLLLAELCAATKHVGPISAIPTTAGFQAGSEEEIVESRNKTHTTK
jgi:hypothetical protein